MRKIVSDQTALRRRVRVRCRPEDARGHRAGPSHAQEGKHATAVTN